MVRLLPRRDEAQLVLRYRYARFEPVMKIRRSHHPDRLDPLDTLSGWRAARPFFPNLSS